MKKATLDNFDLPARQHWKQMRPCLVRRHRDQEKCYEVVWCVYPEEYGESPKKILDPERDTKAPVARGTGGEVFLNMAEVAQW